MAAPEPKAHDRSRKSKDDVDDDDEEMDHVEKMLKKAGCLEQHYAISVCISS